MIMCAIGSSNNMAVGLRSQYVLYHGRAFLGRTESLWLYAHIETDLVLGVPTAILRQWSSGTGRMHSGLYRMAHLIHYESLKLGFIFCGLWELESEATALDLGVATSLISFRVTLEMPYRASDAFRVASVSQISQRCHAFVNQTKM